MLSVHQHISTVHVMSVQYSRSPGHSIGTAVGAQPLLHHFSTVGHSPTALHKGHSPLLVQHSTAVLVYSRAVPYSDFLTCDDTDLYWGCAPIQVTQCQRTDYAAVP